MPKIWQSVPYCPRVKSNQVTLTTIIRNTTTELVQLKLIPFILLITTLIPIREFFRHPCPCAPILYKFHITNQIVRTHGHHPVIVSNSANIRLTLENVWFGNVKHKLWGNPHNISVMHPTKLHTITHLKFVFVRLPLRPAPTRPELFDQIIDSLMDGVIHEHMTMFDDHLSLR